MPPENSSKALAENLYKQGVELSLKNKTLSLLSKLYEISALALTPEELAGQAVKIIKDDLSFELAGILSLEEEKQLLKPIALSSSDRLSKIQSEFSVELEKIEIPLSRSIFLKSIIDKRIPGHSQELTDVWDELIPKEMYAEIKSSGHIKSSLAYPLVTDDKLRGVLFLSLNREIENLTPFENESLSSVVNVITVALDKAFLYMQLKKTNEELASANIRLKELDQQKSEFVSLASHQLRSPLSSIKGYASMLREGDYGALSEDMKKPVSAIEESSKSLATMVDDFLNVSRIEQGTMKFDFTDFDLKKLAEDVVYEQKPTAEKAGLKLSFVAEPNKTFMITADLVKIKQVITNFLDNSIKYTPKGSIDVSISKHEDNKILIKITDTGIGISAETLPKLFSKFTRASDANKTNIHGTGLGLYVAKQMVEAHKGRAWAESAGEGKGSTFYIELQGK